jgi:anhydro-N-acetylmuramic acid kinase
LIVAGVMSGTSADGVDVALVRLLGRGFRTRLDLIAHESFPYPAPVRKAVLAAMNARDASVADLARLNFLLGELYADAVLKAQKRASVECDLIGCHGQTIFHQGDPARVSVFGQKIAGYALACTWQTGEAAIIAAQCNVPVVSDLRPADMAAGGKGAPLVPFLDYMLYRHRRRGRLVQNIGGIGNITAIPARATPEQVLAFDTGPGNMVIDALMQDLFGRAYDKNGRMAARGHVMDNIVSEFLRLAFFRRKPPRTAGREQFGREFVSRLQKRCGRARPEDVIATATALTSRSIAESVKMVIRMCGDEAKFRDMILSGGGGKNVTLMRMIETELQPVGIRVRASDEFGMPLAAKEAVAFAVLAYQTWRHLPGNVPSATGANFPAILGKVSYPPLKNTER